MNRDKAYDRKKIIFGVILAILACITSLKLPYHGKTISETILPVIVFDGFALHLSGLITLGLMIRSSRMFVKSGKYKNKFLLVIIMLLIVLPVFRIGYNYLKRPIYMMNEGVRGIELKASDLNVYNKEGEVIIEFTADVSSYIDEDTPYDLIVELPNNLQRIVEADSVTAYEATTIHKDHDFTIEYSSVLELTDGYTADYLFYEVHLFEDYWVTLKDEEKNTRMTVNDGLF